MATRARRYMRSLRRLKKAKGRGRRKRLRASASRQRKRMVRKPKRKKRRKNPNYRGVKRRAPKRYKSFLSRVESTSQGKKALARFKKFWGIPLPTSIEEIESGKGRTRFLVGMGRSPVAVLSEGPKQNPGRIRKVRGSFMVATDTAGKRIYLIRKKNKGKAIGKNLTMVGYAPETHYVPSRAVEKAGSFKRNAYWIHKHDDEGGRWPRVYKDSSGNFIYGKGTYSVGKWIRK